MCSNRMPFFRSAVFYRNTRHVAIRQKIANTKPDKADDEPWADWHATNRTGFPTRSLYCGFKNVIFIFVSILGSPKKFMLLSLPCCNSGHRLKRVVVNKNATRIYACIYTPFTATITPAQLLFATTVLSLLVPRLISSLHSFLFKYLRPIIICI